MEADCMRKYLSVDTLDTVKIITMVIKMMYSETVAGLFFQSETSVL